MLWDKGQRLCWNVPTVVSARGWATGHMGTGWAPLCTPSERPLVTQWVMAAGGSCPDIGHTVDESRDCLPPDGCHIPLSLGFPTYKPRLQWVVEISQKREGGEGAGP